MMLHRVNEDDSIMEYFNRLSRGGVNCPEVVLLRKHVLVMSFIGTDHNPAPTLKEAKLTLPQLESAYDQCIKVSRKKLFKTFY